MWYKRRPVKIGLVVLAALLLIAVGLVSLSHYKVIAITLPIFGGTPSAPSPVGEYVPGQIIVKFKPGVDAASEAQLNATLGTEVVHTSPYAGFKVLQIPEGKTVAEMVAAYSAQSIVEYAEPNYIDRVLPAAR